MEAKKYPVIITPVVTCAFAYTEEPDTHFGEANAKYRASFKFPKNAAVMGNNLARIGNEDVSADKVIEFLQTIRKEHNMKDNAGFLRDGDTLTDKDGNLREDTQGFWMVTGKSGYQPSRVDSKRNQLPLSVPIRGGDLVRAVLAPKAVQSAVFNGVSLYLQEIMLIEKRAAEGVAIPEYEGDGYVAAESGNSNSCSVDDQTQRVQHGDY